MKNQGATKAKIGARGKARRQALLDAARKLFSEKGFEKTTLTDLVNEAGGSRTSLYEYFGDKHGLLRAMLEEENDQFLAGLATLRPNPAAEPEEALNSMGLHFVQSLTDQNIMSVLRILISEGKMVSEIGETFIQEGPDIVNKMVGEYLQELSRDGKIKIDNPQEAARAFIGMLIGDLFFRQLILPQKSMSQKQMKQWVAHVVRLFLQGALPRT